MDNKNNLWRLIVELNVWKNSHSVQIVNAQWEFVSIHDVYLEQPNKFDLV